MEKHLGPYGSYLKVTRAELAEMGPSILEKCLKECKRMLWEKAMLCVASTMNVPDCGEAEFTVAVKFGVIHEDDGGIRITVRWDIYQKE